MNNRTYEISRKMYQQIFLTKTNTFQNNKYYDYYDAQSIKIKLQINPNTEWTV